VRGALAGKTEASLERQMANRKATGVPGDHVEDAHEVAWILHQQGYTHSVTQVAAQLVSTAPRWNFQGNTRIAFWCKVSTRTVRRARRALEDAGLIKSYLLLPGEQLRGQRTPVHRARVVRDVSGLRGLLPERIRRDRGTRSNGGRRAPASPSATHAAHATTRPKPRPAPRPSAADVPQEPLRTPDDFEDLAQSNPEFAEYFVGIAEGMREHGFSAQRPRRVNPPIPPPAFTPDELDEFDRETDRLRVLEEERRERERKKSERERGPPS